MQDIKERERENRSNSNTGICFEVRATALCLRLHTEGFHYVHTGPSTKRPTLRNYNSTLRVHNLSVKHNHLYIREKVQSQKKEKVTNLVIQ